MFLIVEWVLQYLTSFHKHLFKWQIIRVGILKKNNEIFWHCRTIYSGTSSFSKAHPKFHFWLSRWLNQHSLYCVVNMESLKVLPSQVWISTKHYWTYWSAWMLSIQYNGHHNCSITHIASGRPLQIDFKVTRLTWSMKNGPYVAATGRYTQSQSSESSVSN